MQPTASVIVATHNRSALLARLLDALAGQEGIDAFEVVVVDDASSDDTQNLLERRAPALPFELRVIRQDTNTGPAGARNRGWRAAVADLICFTDDDCRPEPGWLAALVAAAADAGIGLVQGRTDADPDQRPSWGPMSRSMVVPGETGFYETCNVLYRRSVLQELGGFDETFRFPYGEDTDLAWRARKAGVQTSFADDAVVHHEVWSSEVGPFLRGMRRSEGLVLMVSKHPELRDMAGVKVFWRPVHFAALMVALSAMAAAGGRRFVPAWFALGATCMKYWHECRAERRHARASKAVWLSTLPFTLIGDLYELAVMARASVRYRTLLL